MRAVVGFAQRLGHTRLFRWFHPKTARLDRWLYTKTGGRLLASGPQVIPHLLLTTKGRKSGRTVTVPLLYGEHGSDLVVVASNYGRPRHPAWSENLLAQPDATVERDGETVPVVARLASVEEKQAVWPKLVGMWPAYDTYAALGGRDLRVFLLSRKGP